MKKEIVQKEIFISEDGYGFEEEDLCRKHEKKMTLLNEIKSKKVMDKNFYAIFIKAEAGLKLGQKIQEVFCVKNPDIIKEGWNLLYDGGSDSICFPIEDLMKRMTEPIPRTPKEEPKGESKEEQQSLQQVKQKLLQIISSPRQMQGASPEGILGNIILMLQELVASIK